MPLLRQRVTKQQVVLEIVSQTSDSGWGLRMFDNIRWGPRVLDIHRAGQPLCGRGRRSRRDHRGDMYTHNQTSWIGGVYGCQSIIGKQLEGVPQAQRVPATVVE